MMNLYEMFDKEMKSSFSANNNREALTHFFRAMKIKAEIVASDLVVNNTPVLQSQSGQIKAFYELAEWAGAALSTLESEAKDKSDLGIPLMQL